jgi:formylglycine-generating enzyme required for sulfatase activity
MHIPPRLRLLAPCLLLAASLLLPLQTLAQETRLRAFPGAEGFGACTPGGRGGRVLYVTTLADYLPGKDTPIEGSLRHAIEAKGPRIVLFRVSGNIALKADLWVRDPYLTVAGQSAPGGGICIRDYQFVLASHDIILRHLRFRAGDLTRKEQMSVGIFGGSEAIIDHCSMTWAIDEVMSAFGARNLTVQWSIVSEGLSRSYHPKGEHSKGSIIDGTGGFSIHHTLYAHNASRNPRVNTVLLDFRNNILYNWGYRAAYTTEAPSYVNWIGNYLKPGPSTRSSARTKVIGLGDDMPRFYLAGNVLEGHAEQTADNTLLLHPEDVRLGSTAPQPFPVPPVTTDSAEIALERVLAGAGALLPQRDSADLRLIQEATTGTGRIIDSQEQLGGWPTLATAEPAPDLDVDGMPDAWEERHALDLKNASDGAADADADGYTNVEEFLNTTDPRSPELDCRVDAAEFDGLLQQAADLAAAGTREFEAREARAIEDRHARNEQRAATLKASVQPHPETAGALQLDIAGEATLDLLPIPAGSFLMGTPESEGGLDRERPQHRVTISRAFHMAASKISTRQFNAVFGPGARKATEENLDLPAAEVTWFEATEFCGVLSKATGRTFRLPTEAEWEYACRAGTTTAFYTGDTITSDDANFDAAEATPFNPPGTSRGKITPVQSFPPNPWGLYDMHGNQAAYCQDYCFRAYTAEDVTDPTGPVKESGARVLRGGKATSKAYFLRSGYRYGYTPGVGYSFRVVMEAN